MPPIRKRLKQTSLKVVPRIPFTWDSFDISPEASPKAKKLQSTRPKLQNSSNSDKPLEEKSSIAKVATSIYDVDGEIPLKEEQRGRYEEVGDGYVRLLPPYMRDYEYPVSRLIFPLWAVDTRFERPRSVEPLPTVLSRPPAGLRHRMLGLRYSNFEK